MKRPCVVCGREFDPLEPGHRGPATVCKPTCAPEGDAVFHHVDRLELNATVRARLSGEWRM